MKNQKRYQEIEYLRGIATICVLLGHSFPDAQTGMTHPVAICIYNCVYAFHMALFLQLQDFVF